MSGETSIWAQLGNGKNKLKTKRNKIAECCVCGRYPQHERNKRLYCAPCKNQL